MATSSKSFKRHGPPPPRYRTPSPPRYAVEPISPITSDDSAIEALGMRWATDYKAHNEDKTHKDGQHDRSDDLRKRGHGSRGSMDAFASIALATSSVGLHQDDSFAVRLPFGIVGDESGSAERPSKRARSEKLPSPEWHRTGAKSGSRPATSYEQSADSRTIEAELLLNFSHEARFSTPWPSHRRSTSDVPQTAPLLNGTHGFVLGPTIDDQAPHNGTQFPELVVHKALETPLDRPDIGDSEYAEAGLNSSEVTSHRASPPQHSGLQHIGANGTRGLGHILTFTSPQCMANSYDSRATEQLLEAGKEAIPETLGQIVGTQSDEMNNSSGTASETLETESSQFADLDTQDLDRRPGIKEDGMPLTKAGGLEAAQGESAQEARGLLSSPAHPTETSTPIVSEAVAVNSEILTSFDAPSNADPTLDSTLKMSEAKPSQATAPAVCAACNFTRNSLSVENDNSSTSWISCDGCKGWFHFACAGFKSEREVRGVDKYRCRKCKPIYGPTTYVRKSSRAHTAIDYAGLHQGVLKTSDETPEHHYIKPIKDGTITFLPENFARMRPELVTAEYFEKGTGMKEPVVVPAHFNPRPGDPSSTENNVPTHEEAVPSADPLDEVSMHEDWFSLHLESQRVPDHGQDALDMVIPRGLTVRRVAELYGPEEKVEVIDVKSQNGEGKKWNMRRWADYYESGGNKVVRNVISLEVSQSKLGRLIRRPQIVRDLDLQDSVWPLELQTKGEYPRVQFYCLMSVADCFTDFHIDFGGSSVFYHILKGKKTFLFIPPKEKHLKKYEEWCMSPAQNWTFLADQTKECYRVDLAEGDTMLIPAGWIHAVWTPEDSLVIGGNFLTRLNYGMQLRISQIEKATGVARKFRYPHFQKIHWYTALRYLEDDPLPDSVKNILQDSGTFHREQPAHYDFDAWGENSRSGRENYHARYYAQAELEGLPDLTRYLLRTALIDLGSITEGITTETRNAVKKSIPRGHGEPLDIVKRLAMWSAWKRGESIPSWAFAGIIPEGVAPETAVKLSTAAAKKAALEAAPRRQSARRASQQHSSSLENVPALSGDVARVETTKRQDLSNTTAPISEPGTPPKKQYSHLNPNDQPDTTLPGTTQKRKPGLGTGTSSHRKPACESCRKRRRACKHRDQVDIPASNALIETIEDSQIAGVSRPESLLVKNQNTLVGELRYFADGEQHTPQANIPPSLFPPKGALSAPTMDSEVNDAISPGISLEPNNTTPRKPEGIIMNVSQSRGRSKACNDCRKSKRRCIHDEHGNIDAEKANEAAVPRPAATLKRRKLHNEGQDSPVTKKQRGPAVPTPHSLTHLANDSAESMIQLPHMPVQRPAPVANMMGRTPSSAPTANMMGRSSTLDNRQSDQARTAALTSDADLANQALCQLNNAIIDTQARGDEKCKLQPLTLETSREPAEIIEDEVQLVAMPPTSNLKAEAGFVREVPLPDESFPQPAASSLVSPPASSHNDAGHTPPASEPNRTPSSSSSRHSSRHPKQVQRYTPESGSARRASSSSITDTMVGKSASLISREETANIGGDIDASQKRAKPRLSSETFTDEESLRLIKELQAQDYGLRRRGRA